MSGLLCSGYFASPSVVSGVIFYSGQTIVPYLTSGSVGPWPKPKQPDELFVFYMEHSMSRDELMMLRVLQVKDDPTVRKMYVDYLLDHDRRESAELVRRGFTPGLGFAGKSLEGA